MSARSDRAAREAAERIGRLADAREFAIITERNRRLALWAGGLLGKSGADLDAYAKEIARADMEETGTDDILAKVEGDLAAAGHMIPIGEVGHRLEAIEAELRAEAE